MHHGEKGKGGKGEPDGGEHTHDGRASLRRATATSTPRHPTLGNRQSGTGNRGGRPPHTAPRRRFFTAASPRHIISHSHDSPFPIADSQGWGDVGRSIPHSRLPIPTGGVVGRGRFPRVGWGGREWQIATAASAREIASSCTCHLVPRSS